MTRERAYILECLLAAVARTSLVADVRLDLKVDFPAREERDRERQREREREKKEEEEDCACVCVCVCV